ncbi:ABC transporter ATP-binding protein [Sporosarcina thermotolerans]|uniref:ABC transporter ATP-binding protein n=1 Tax=Sporosarcina thermotolerans TaxID=633404 RepID=A0AAW9ACH9_9BACL|nr:ABC transporter ATP-binding protein [Sporosarcina thermotolerans]MDW0117745.1 ABC transporter ATP-binding protein [Sporosarcina thermotolerans]WHT49164.1 ABC transporter ATP-binding protein [Sporosarcina thermotolerans]
MDIVVQTTGIRKVYGTKSNLITVLEDIDFAVQEGEFVAIMGPSGAGKTTLLNILATIDKPTSGSVRINGTEITSLSDEPLSEFRRSKLGFIFQDYNLLDSLTIRENIMLPMTFSNKYDVSTDLRVNEIAGKLGIGAILDRYPYETSGGQKQRAAAARAIIHNPTLVLADEPTGALDSKASMDLLSAFQLMNNEYGTTILMVTHDAFAASYCDRVLFMKDGRLFTEIVKGDKDRKWFFDRLVMTLSNLGGGSYDII